MNLWRIFGIGGAAFCTAALAGVGLGVQTPFIYALAVAAIQGGLAAFQEIEKESANSEPPSGPTVHLAGVMLL